MKISLLTKNVIGICVALTTLFFAGFYYHYQDIKKYQINSVKDEFESTAFVLSTNLFHEYDFHKTHDIQSLLDHSVRHKKDILAVAVYDISENLIAFSSRSPEDPETDIIRSGSGRSGNRYY
jgi:hypothetical protein